MSEKKTKMQSVTIRIPEDLYSEYKKVLAEQGKIVTYDVRIYMDSVVREYKKENK